jgi:3'-phosphoadenosine 5'-phosphosulfate (PAPS) 3'-phosphatase
MYRNTKTIIKACEKASINLRRDISEVVHLQTSRNLKNFLVSSQNRFERNISSELNFAEPSNIIIYEKSGSFKNISNVSYKSDEKRVTEVDYIVVGIDNMINLSHGIEHVGFSIVSENSAAICVPAMNSIVYTETEGEAFLLEADGLPKKLRMNQSLNISLPSILCSMDSSKHKAEELLGKRAVHFVSSGSILCDAVRVVENKIDIAFHSIPENSEYIQAITAVVNAAGGADGFIDDSYVFGKKSIVKPLLSL